MLKKILSISGKPGLFRLVSQGRNMLIVENLSTGKRMPAYARDKVVSLGDISIYTTQNDVPLSKVLDSVQKTANGQPVDVKAMNDSAVREYFKTVLPDYDEERVYTTDIRKLINWYNQLMAVGITDFHEDEAAADDTEKADGIKDSGKE